MQRRKAHSWLLRAPAAANAGPTRGLKSPGGIFMKLNGLQHLNIRCAVSDLPAIEKFYSEVMGLKKGPRPNFPNEGIWLWSDTAPLIHVSARCAEGFLQEKHHSSVDHIAFAMNGAADFRDRVKKLGLAFEQQNVPQAGFQIF